MPDVADDVNEHPAIFNGWSIRGILDDRKTQTRRIVSDYDQMLDLDGGRWPWFEDEHGDGHMKSCPYGEAGDVLWVREAFRIPEKQDGKRTPKEYARPGSAMTFPHVRYEADGEWDNSVNIQSLEPDWGRKRPAIHMPKEFCRLRLRVEDVRVERVQEIAEHDALAEGIRKKDYEANTVRFEGDPRLAFADKWREIHGHGAWERNDWVWVIKFSRINDE